MSDKSEKNRPTPGFRAPPAAPPGRGLPGRVNPPARPEAPPDPPSPQTLLYKYLPHDGPPGRRPSAPAGRPPRASTGPSAPAWRSSAAVNAMLLGSAIPHSSSGQPAGWPACGRQAKRKGRAGVRPRTALVLLASAAGISRHAARLGCLFRSYRMSREHQGRVASVSQLVTHM